MPYVNVQITTGATKEQKKKKPEHTHIVIQEIADENWGFEGLPTDEWKKNQKKS